VQSGKGIVNRAGFQLDDKVNVSGVTPITVGNYGDSADDDEANTGIIEPANDGFEAGDFHLETPSVAAIDFHSSSGRSSPLESLAW
jgi:hypothetical protein